MRSVYRISGLITRKLTSSSGSSSLFRRRHRSAAPQMSNIYRLDSQGTGTLTCWWRNLSWFGELVEESENESRLIVIKFI